MKVLMCRECGDLVRLHTGDFIYCKCRKSKGRYRPDGDHVEITENSVLIGIANPDLESAVRHIESPSDGLRMLRAWVFKPDYFKINTVK